MQTYIAASALSLNHSNLNLESHGEFCVYFWLSQHSNWQVLFFSKKAWYKKDEVKISQDFGLSFVNVEEEGPWVMPQNRTIIIILLCLIIKILM